jgi:uncharacterized protein (TIGR02145 family)
VWQPNEGEGSQLPFECGDALIDSRDGQSYNTILIDDQCWMKENLNIGTMVSGSHTQTDNGIIEKYCYDNNTDNCETFGGLYQWDEMMQYASASGAQGICPAGWHIPTDAEWCALENFVDSGTVPCSATGWRGTDAGKNLKSTTGWSSGGNGVDIFEFTAFPAGRRGYDGSFYNQNTDVIFWASFDFGISSVVRILNYNHNKTYRHYADKLYGFSVRCLRD